MTQALAIPGKKKKGSSRKKKPKTQPLTPLPLSPTVIKATTTLSSLGNLTSNQYLRYRATQDAAIWCRLYCYLKGKRMRFKSPDPHFHRPFLEQILSDHHPYKVVEKSRQAGGSEISLREVLWFLCTKPDTKWMYVFPRKQQLEDFSRTRIQEAIDSSDYLKAKAIEPQNVTLKRFAPSSFLFMRSGWEPDLGEGVDADGVTFDEKDRMNPNVEIAFRESLSSSKFGWKRELSTPTLPKQGVDRAFQESDQNFWFVKCTDCGHEQILDYPDNIIPLLDVKDHWDYIPDGSYRFGCSKCRGEVNRMEGRWIPEYPSKIDVRGYRISQLMCPWINADQIMRKKKEFKIDQLFMNYVIGRPYHGAGLLVTKGHFNVDPTRREMNMREFDMDWVSVGVDWGGMNWFVVLGKKQNRIHVLKIGWFPDTANPLESTKAIVNALIPFRPDMIVGDAGYGKDRNAYLSKSFPDKAYSCFYQGTAGNKNKLFKPIWHANGQKVTVEKTTSLKIMCQEIVDGALVFYSGTEGFDLIQDHVCNLTTRNEIDGENITEVIDNMGQDHLADALNYARIGMEKISSGNTFHFGFLDVTGGYIPGEIASV